jgi:hypothetical protein
MLAIRKFANELLRQGTRGRLVAGVPAWLTATGLRLRHHHLATGTLQQLQGSESDGGPHHVGQAGDKESDAHAGKKSAC